MVNKYTSIANRLALYQEAKKYFIKQYGPNWPDPNSYFLCNLLFGLSNAYRSPGPSRDTFVRSLPEFWNQRPFSNEDFTGSWFKTDSDGTALRIKVLEKCVEECYLQLDALKIRKHIYAEAVHLIQEGKYNFICHAIATAVWGDYTKHRSMDFEKQFPEFWSQKPFCTGRFDAWFEAGDDSRNKRLAVLNTCIDFINKQLYVTP